MLFKFLLYTVFWAGRAVACHFYFSTCFKYNYKTSLRYFASLTSIKPWTWTRIYTRDLVYRHNKKIINVHRATIIKSGNMSKHFLCDNSVWVYKMQSSILSFNPEISIEFWFYSVPILEVFKKGNVFFQWVLEFQFCFRLIVVP